MRGGLRNALCLGLALVAWLGTASAVDAQGRGRGDRDGAPGLFEPARRPPASLRRWIESLPPVQRRAAVQRLRQMRPLERQRFFRQWEGMTASERRQFQRRLEQRAERAIRAAKQQRRRQIDRDALRKRVEEMSPPERRAFRRQMDQWRQLGPQGKERMRGRLEVFRALSAEQQVALIEKQFPARSADERARILTRLRAASEALGDAPPDPDTD